VTGRIEGALSTIPPIQDRREIIVSGNNWQSRSVFSFGMRKTRGDFQNAGLAQIDNPASEAVRREHEEECGHG
jgi:hypothetical protein